MKDHDYTRSRLPRALTLRLASGTFALVLGFCFAASPASVSAGVMNGDFEAIDSSGTTDRFVGWEQVDSKVPLPAIASTSGDQFAQFATSTAASVGLFQNFEIPTGATALLFEYRILGGESGDSTSISGADTFQAVITRLPYTDSSSFFAPSGEVFPAFFSVDHEGGNSFEEFLGPGVSVRYPKNGRREVRLDLRQPGQPLPAEVNLNFLLQDADDGIETTVELDNVRITQNVIPEQGAVAIWSMVAVGALVARRRIRGVRAAA